MELQNTKHLINNHRLTVICLKGDERILLDKLLSGLNDKGYATIPYPNTQTFDELAKEYLKPRQNQLTVINLDGLTTFDQVETALQNNMVKRYVNSVNSLIEFAELNNVRLLATVTLDKVANIRSIYFRIAEELKDKVCFVRFVNIKDNAVVRLQIESGENAWQYISYCLDDDGDLKETY